MTGSSFSGSTCGVSDSELFCSCSWRKGRKIETEDGGVEDEGFWLGGRRVLIGGEDDDETERWKVRD